MDKQNRNDRSGRSPYTNSGKRGQNNNINDLDRYNYVDRDLYSSSSRNAGSGRRSGKRNNRKKGGFKKAAFTILSLVVVAGLCVIAYALIMMSRLDRTDTANTANYVAQPSDAPTWGVISDSKITNILLIGIDKNDDGSDGRSDTNMLISIDNNTKTIHLVSFLRDTYLEIPTVGKTRLNSAFAHGGAALTMQTLENNFRVNIDKYVSVNSQSFATIIDKMGGLDIKMTKALCDAENRNMGSHLKPGVNHLDGKLSLYYARIRETDSDFGRTGRQREVVELMIKKMMTLNPLEVNKIMFDYLQYVKTNLTDPELLYLASIAGPVSKYEMKTMHVPNVNTYKDKKIDGIGAVLVPDLPKNSELLRAFLYGEDTVNTTASN